jgi:hypothetical protein
MIFNFKFWIRVAIINLLIVAFLGVIMRYKIGFSFPYLNQKNLQHAHSHFAFGGWISMMIMVMMLYSVKEKLALSQLRQMKPILYANLITAYGMLVSFAMQGYAFFSIAFSSLSIIISFWFSYQFYVTLKSSINLPGLKWMNVALFFNLFSSFGTLALSYMMATRQLEQHAYLASVYWYLHFQYNGWFFFACLGLFVNFLYSKNVELSKESMVFKLFAFSCIPAYGLSVLWLNLPLWIYIIVVIAALGQFLGLFIFLKQIIVSRFWEKFNLSFIAKFLLIFAGTALACKVTLQVGSTVPIISKFAFGFRPIVIAYLHLVLLAFTSVFLIVYAYMNNLIVETKLAQFGVIIFVLGVLLNEIILGIQGIFSISYTMVPFANEILFIMALMMFVGLVLLNVSLVKQKN